MNEDSKCCIATIADSQFVLAAYVLALSLRYHGVKAKVKVLGIQLSAAEKRVLEQIEGVETVDSQHSPSSCKIRMRALANLCKREAIMAAAQENTEIIALFDGDCIVTGDITPYLSQQEPGLYLRKRSAPENRELFRSRYELQDKPASIPGKVLKRWKADVAEDSESKLDYAVLSGNLTIHRDFLDFINYWGDFMERVLPYQHKEFDHVAYEMMGDFSLSAVIAYAKNIPPIYNAQFDKDPNAYIAHLGPKPKYWVYWPKHKLRYYWQVIRLLEWAEEQGYQNPPRPWSLCRKHYGKVLLYAYSHHFLDTSKALLRPAYLRLNPRSTSRRRSY